jgi:hypothetical protein
MIEILEEFLFKRISYKKGRKMQKNPFSEHETLILERDGKIKVTKKQVKKNATSKRKLQAKDKQSEEA